MFKLLAPRTCPPNKRPMAEPRRRGSASLPLPESFVDLESLAVRIAYLADRQAANLIVGISGLEAAGKSTTADRLTDLLSSRQVIVIRGDWFSRAKEARNADPDPVAGYLNDAYDYEYLRSEVLGPMAGTTGGDIAIETLEPTTDGVTRRTFSWGEGAIVIVEGVLLFRGRMKSCFDYRIWIDVDFKESRFRASQRKRDLDYYPSVTALLARYATRFHPAQQLHIMEDDPDGTAHGILRPG